MTRKRVFLLSVTLCCLTACSGAASRYSAINGHSHNDYKNEAPFRLAYERRFGSIEADIWVSSGGLYVAHYENEIRPERTLDALYIEPIAEAFRRNGGAPWKGDTDSFQLLVDLKSPAEPALSMLIARLSRYPEVFDARVNRRAVRVVITGNRPVDMDKYPDIVSFDGESGREYDKAQLKRIALFSGDFRRFSSWSGTGPMAADEKLRVRKAVDSAHALKKKIRFWNAPDGPEAWERLMDMGVDLINTDRVAELADYLNRR